MDYSDFIKNITSYIDDELKIDDKREFENAIKNNEDWASLFNDIKNNDKILRNSLKIRTNSDFIVKLNNKIDKLESKQHIHWSIYLREYFSSINPAPAMALMCITLILTFSFFKMKDFGYFPSLSYDVREEENNQLNNTYIADNAADSLSSKGDSLNYPILLIGNGR